MVVLMGPPGAGKTTVARRLQEAAGAEYVSTGQMFRELAARGDVLAEQVAAVIESGDLQPDERVTGLLTDRLAPLRRSKRLLIIDGYPRRVGQGEKLDAMLAPRRVSTAIALTVSQQVALARLASRHICEACRAILHGREEIDGCRQCGGASVKRLDDTPEILAERFLTYQRHSEPAQQYYRETGRLETVDAERPIEDVVGDVIALAG